MSKESTLQASQTDWEALEKMNDEDIDMSEIPEVTADQIAQATLRVGGKPVVDNIYSTQRLLKQINDMLSVFNNIPQQIISEHMSLLNQINFSIQVPDIYFALPVIDTAWLMDAFSASSKIIESIVSTKEWQQAYTQQIAEIMKGFDLGMQRIAVDLTAFRLSFQDIISSGSINYFLELLRADKEAIDAFKAANWPIAPSMSQGLRDHVIDLHMQGNTRYISGAISGYYRRSEYENLKDMVEGWENHPLFTPRMHIIRDAFEAHCRGSYTLSIPTLMPQIEGILNDYVVTNNLSVRLGKIKRVYDAVIGDPDEYGLSNWAIANTLLYQLQTNTYVYTDFEQELRRSANGRQTTRHTVLHGVTINYHRHINSLKIFVLLDAISALAEIEEDQHEYYTEIR